MHDKPVKVTASAIISELQSSDIYLTVKARLFDLNANLNGVRVTAAFMNEIVQNEDKYIGIPLYADIRGLINNRTIGHMYDSRTGEFHSTQIGSFYHYELENDKDTTYLAGFARIPKRNKAVCQAIADLFAENELKFSFEISCGSYSVEDDGTFVIDADPSNYFEGEAIVTFPACEGAVATALVAELTIEVESKGDENMKDAELKEVAEAETAEEPVKEVAETVEAETIESKTVTEETTTNTYDTETGEETETVDVHIERTRTVAEEAAEPEAEHKETAEAQEDADEEEREEEEEEHEECASVNEDLRSMIAEISKQVEALRAEIAEMNKPKEEPVEVQAEVEPKAEEPEQINPFMAEISTPKKYSLLDREEKKTTTYSLLDRA